KELASAFIASPLIRAYSLETALSFKEFRSLLVSHAEEWGATAVGSFLLSGHEPPRFDDDRFVLAVGYHKDQAYAAVGSRTTDIQVVEYDWPMEWLIDAAAREAAIHARSSD